MKEKRKPIGYWDDIDKCKQEALKFQSRSEFSSNSSVAYRNLLLDNSLDELFPLKYSKELCKNEALKYKYKKDFRKYSPLIYAFSLRKKWYDEITTHMKSIGDRYHKLVYVYEFPDNHVYIGLTYNEEKRYNEHLNDIRTSVYKHRNKTGLSPKYFTISDYMKSEDAQELEHNTLLNYINNGWIILNTGKTGRGIGSIGGNTIKWTFEACMIKALEYDNYNDFIYKSKGAYNSAKTNKWLKEISSHMKKYERKKV